MWKCPKCGEMVEDTFDVCWNCGTARDGTEDPSFRRADDTEPPDDARPAPVGTPTPSPASAPATEPADATAARPSPRRRPRAERAMIVTTTPGVEGRRITRYCGIVTGEAILGANLFKDFFASITDIVGGRSSVYERVMRRARDIAVAELEEAARDLGANAVVGVDLDYETLGQTNGMLMVSVSGTAVVVE